MRGPVTLKGNIREYGGAYIARCNGKTASCTSMPRYAVIRAVLKAAAVLQTLGVIGELPNEDGITVREYSGGRWEATF